VSIAPVKLGSIGVSSIIWRSGLYSHPCAPCPTRWTPMHTCPKRNRLLSLGHISSAELGHRSTSVSPGLDGVVQVLR